MRFFFDTEFIERGRKYPIELISIGIVAEDGRTFYAISNEFDERTAGDWVKEHVLPQLKDTPFVIHSVSVIAQHVLRFIWPDEKQEKPEFWGYYADYDWVVFCQMFGTMMDLPKGFPMWCRDIKQLCADCGDPELPEQGKGEHNALADALWNKVAWEFLRRSAPSEV